jgi:nucleoside-triphosphatase
VNLPLEHILLTGRPGVGKTTLICRIARTLIERGRRPVGFYTEEIREGGVRRGFRIVTLDGRTRVLAHVEHKRPARVGRYGVDVACFEALLRELDLPSAPQALTVIDEIGKMECLSSLFVRQIRAILDSRRPLLATVAARGQGLIREVKDRGDVRLIPVTVQNRDRLVEEIITMLGMPSGLPGDG